MALDLNYFKKALLEEKKRLEGELETIAEKNPDQPKDWRNLLQEQVKP